jgi:hypothetical protein
MLIIQPSRKSAKTIPATFKNRKISMMTLTCSVWTNKYRHAERPYGHTLRPASRDQIRECAVRQHPPDQQPHQHKCQIQTPTLKGIREQIPDPDQSSLHNTDRTGITQKQCKLHFFLQKTTGSKTTSIPRDKIKYPSAKSALLVELSGIEPLTPCLQSRCSPS